MNVLQELVVLIHFITINILTIFALILIYLNHILKSSRIIIRGIVLTVKAYLLILTIKNI